VSFQTVQAGAISLGQQVIGIGGETVAAGATLTLPAGSTSTAAIPQVGFDAYLNIFSSDASAAAVRITAIWFLNGTFTSQRTYYVWPGTSAAEPNVFEWTGPTRGNQVTLEITNLGSGTLTVTGFQFNQNSRLYAVENFRSTWEVNAPAAATIAPNDVMAGLLAGISTAVGAGDTATYALPMYAGKCIIAGSVNVAAADFQLYVSPGADPNLTVDPIVLFADASGAIDPTEVYLPYAQCQINLRNLDSSDSHNFDATITIAEY
jgi:hypothetical protein